MRSLLVRRWTRQAFAVDGGFFRPERLAWSEAGFLEAFQPIWRELRRMVPHWAKDDLPESFRSYEEFARLPFMRRSDIQRSLGEYCSRDLANTDIVSTGGSTGRPLRFPMYRSELEVGRSHQLCARRLYGIEPGARCLVIWGHSAGMDRGFRAWKSQVVRAAKDVFMGYRRISAYCLTREILRRQFERSVKFRPEWVYAYSTSLLSFVRANQDRRDTARQLGLKACIGAAEPMSAEMRQEIGDFFGCPVGMEYGSVEMRVCAHTRPDRDGYHVFTEHHLIEAIPTSEPRVFEVAVTKLFRSAMPLVRYLVGDHIRIDDADFGGGPVTRFDDVIGRNNDNLVLADGSEIHSETITHAIRGEASVLAFQLHQRKEGIVLKLVLAESSALDQIGDRIRERLARVHPALRKIAVDQVEDVEPTPAGKRRWIVRSM